MSIGLINHHFPSKSGLIAETYETLALSLQDSIRLQAGKQVDTGPREIERFFRASFAPEILDPQLFNVWVVFWSMVAHSPEIRAVHDRTYGKYRSILESLLGQLVASGEAPPFKLRPAAIALSALLDGLWVELSLSPATFKPREAIALCEDWINALWQRRVPPVVGASPRQKGEVVPQNAPNPGSRRKGSLALRGPPCYTIVQQELTRPSIMEAKRSLHNDVSTDISADLDGFSLPGWIYRDADFLEAEKEKVFAHFMADRLPSQRHSQSRRLPYAGFSGRAPWSPCAVKTAASKRSSMCAVTVLHAWWTGAPDIARAGSCARTMPGPMISTAA